MDPEITQEVADIAAELRLDSRETAFFARELETIKARTYDIEYPELKARQFVPVSHDGGPNAEKITYRQWDSFGMAQIIAHWADDLPHVELAGKEFSINVSDIGIAYGYSKREIAASAAAGKNLPTLKGEKAKEYCERRVDYILTSGIPEKGYPGLVNHPNVSILTLPTGTWASASAENILADMNYMVTQIVTNTKQTHYPDTMVLPTALFMLISQKVAGNQLADTVLGIFLKTNPFIKSVETWVKLDTAASDGSGRVLCYKRDPAVLEGEICQEFQQEAPVVKGRGFEVETSVRIAGVVLRAPLALAYADNAM